MFTPGTPKPAASGRKPGTPNRATAQARDLAESLGIDPFEVLLRFAAGDTEALGLKPYVDGKGRQREPGVPLDLRMQAAAAATRFLLPQLKAVDLAASVTSPVQEMLALGEEGIKKRMAEIQLALSDDE